MFIGTWWCLAAVVVGCSGERWQFPGESAASSVRIDNKVKFIDGEQFKAEKRQSESRVQSVQADEVPFHEPTDTEGFYNRPPGQGRYPVTVEKHPRAPYRVNGQAIFPVYNRPKNYESDGTLDSLQYCKCVSTPDCHPHADSERACGAQKYLCCYKRPTQGNIPHSEYFNEIDDERPSLLPGRENFARPFPPPPEAGYPHNGGALDRPQSVPVGPQGPANNVGNPGVLVGPDGPTGVIGPAQQNPAVLVGPNGPTGHIGPINNQGGLHGSDGKDNLTPDESAQRGVLVGPGGPTGIIGPAGGFSRRPVLVGPGGPTGIIGPVRTGRQGVLVGPGGPTGIIGPGYDRRAQPGVLVGPGGPTGVIGPGRGILVGPGGPTGRIGPRFFDY
ncbi:collagen alpha-2(I) chain [Manduca sexta]|uniref:collagen alpha-2(I) chain n=1 Tax=Manduca sexta TaxID=7130 RepID=UPI00188EB125|nr:collagen alpha-2(I) chain [Manduca sexta]